MKHASVQVDLLSNEYVILKEKVAMVCWRKKVRKMKSCTSSAHLP